MMLFSRKVIHTRLRSQFRRGEWSPSLVEQAERQLQRHPDNGTLLDYLEFRHAIQGHSGSSLQKLLDQSLEINRKLDNSTRYRIAALCVEHQVALPDHLCNLPVRRKLSRYPSLLAGCDEYSRQLCGLESRGKKSLGRFVSLASDLQRRTHLLTDSLSGLMGIRKICVVGNAATESGKHQQHIIDGADLVFRFNNAVTSEPHRQAYGSRTDFWVISPSYPVNPGKLKSQRVVISGISPFDKPSVYWQTLAAIRETDYFVFPATVWYSLVAKLQAPPSAGLLCLATLMQWRPECIEVDTFGISRSAVTGQNHYGDAHKRSSRHNWPRESELVNQLLYEAA